MANLDENQEFIDKFKRISQESILREYEKKNREEISESSLIVRDAFDQVWKKITGNSYYQPTPTIQAPTAMHGKNNTERSDPRSRKYRALVTFEKIEWVKIRRKMAKKFREFFILKGDVKGVTRPIYQNLDADRLLEVVGETATKAIIKAGKTNTEGELKGPFDILVEGYWEVVFAPQKGQNDTVDAELTWEGQCLIIKRQTDVVLPGFYLEIADNAIKALYDQTPEQGRKKSGYSQEYPYTVIREASRDEYITLKSAGDAIMSDKRRREE